MKTIVPFEMLTTLANGLKEYAKDISDPEQMNHVAVSEVADQLDQAKRYLMDKYPTYNSLLEYSAYRMLAEEAKALALASVFKSTMSDPAINKLNEFMRGIGGNEVPTGILNHMLEVVKNMYDEVNPYYVNRVKGEIRAEGSAKGAEGAEILHSRPGGSREKREKIRAIWATGKYESRDVCAEQECAALGMSFSTARKALRNTPEPS